MTISLQEVSKKDKGVLTLLMDDYLGELYQYKEINIGPGSVNEYEYFDEYWSDSNRHPFFILNLEKVVGFVLMRRILKNHTFSYELLEFYIFPESRKRGFGKLAVNELFSKYCGYWELQVYILNKSASLFWRDCMDNNALVKEVKLEQKQRKDAKVHQYSFVVEKCS